MTSISDINNIFQSQLADNPDSLTISSGDFETDSEVAIFLSEALGITNDGSGIIALVLNQIDEELLANDSDTGPISVHGKCNIFEIKDLVSEILFEDNEGQLEISFDGSIADPIPVPVMHWITIEEPGIKLSMTSEYNILNLNFYGTIDFSGHLIDINLDKISEDSWTLKIGNDTDSVFQLSNLSDLINLTGGDTFSHFLPDALVSILDAISLTGMNAQFDPVAMSIAHISIGFQYAGANDEWAIIPEVEAFKMRGLSFRLTLIDPTTSGKIINGIAQGTIIVNEIEVPIFVQGSGGEATDWVIGMIAGSEVTLPNLSDLFDLCGKSDLFDMLPKGLMDIPAISIEELEIDFDPTAGTLEKMLFYINTDASWEIIEGLLTVENFHLEMTIKNLVGDADTTMIVQFNSSFLIGSTHIQVSMYKLEEEDWIFTGSLASSDTINLTDAIESLLDSLISIESDSSLNLVLTEADISIIPAVGTIDFSASVEPETPLTLGILLNDLVAPFGLTGMENLVPSAISNLEIEKLTVSFNTTSGDFKFGTELIWNLSGTTLDIRLDFMLNRQTDGTYAIKVEGGIFFHDLEFDLIFNESSTDTFFVAVFQSASGIEVDIKDLAANLSEDFAGMIPEGMTFEVEDALFAWYEPDGAAASKYLFAIDWGGGIDLSNLPLVGNKLSLDQTLEMAYQVIIASDDFKTDEIDTLSDLLPEGNIKIPAQDLTKGLDIITTLRLGDYEENLSLPVGVDTSGQLELDPDATDEPLSQNTENPNPTTGPDDENTTWFDVQKSLGPAYFDRVGIGYPGEILTFAIDASLSIVGLTISLDGLSVSSPLTELDPSFSLDGIGILYKAGTVEIGGAFLKTTVPYGDGEITEYNGAATIGMDDLTLSAIGSYADLGGDPSLFVYAFLDYPIGGPSYFFVTGLAAGFGYNRKLIMPSVSKVGNFPLVKEAMNGAVDPKNPGAELANLDDAVALATGEYFLAAGIKFNSFKLIDSFILLVVSFGKHIEVDLLGISSLKVPSEAEAGATPLAVIELAIAGSFVPDDGLIGVEGQLTSKSYILSKNCKLTGGFAFYSWFSGSHEGDFAITIGGYHPDFKVPSHYPKVPRLGFDWKVDSHLELQGEAYFAMVPGYVMAGGKLNGNWKSGDFEAWFEEAADFIIAWKPYHYDANISMRMGASYTFKAFGIKKKASAEVGTKLHIWGPEFGGKATVDVSVVSFDVKFGASNNSSSDPIGWTKFKNSFLPDDDKILNLVVNKGLISTIDVVDDDVVESIWIINPKEFSLSVLTAFPFKTASRVIKTGSEESIDLTDPDNPINPNISFGVKPMGITSARLTSTLTVKITKDGEIEDYYIEEEGDGSITSEPIFSYSPILKNIPAAMWESGGSQKVNSTRTIKDAMMGLLIGPSKLAEPGQTEEIQKSKLSYETNLFPSEWNYETDHPLQFVLIAETDVTTVPNTINESLNDDTTKADRITFLQKLGLDISENLSGNTGAIFLRDPEILATS